MDRNARNARTKFAHRIFLPSGYRVIRNQIDVLKCIFEKIRKLQSRESLPLERLLLRSRQVAIEPYIYWLEAAELKFVERIQPGKEIVGHLGGM